jgi:hypothetical protein
MVDGGKEFRSVWFEVFCAAYSVRIQRRPKSKARFGAQIERFFGTTNTQLLYAMICREFGTEGAIPSAAAVARRLNRIGEHRYFMEAYRLALEHAHSVGAGS